MISRLPVRVSAPLVIGVPVLLVGLLLTWMWNRQSRQAVVELAHQNIEQIHDLASTKVADVLSIPVRVTQLNEHLIRSETLSTGDLATWRPILAKEAQSFPMLSAISWGSEDGRSVWVSRYADGTFYWAAKEDGSAQSMAEWPLDPQGEIPLQPVNTFEFDVHSRPWFQGPSQSGEPTWSAPYLWVGGVDSAGPTLGISYGVPVRDSAGSIMGVIDADYSLNDLSGFLNTIRIGENGVAALSAADGTLLATSNDAAIVTSEGALLPAADSADTLIAAAARFQASSSTGSAPGRTKLEIAGEPHYVQTSPVGHELGLNWSLLTIVPEKDFLGDIESQFRTSALASLFAVLVAAVLGVMVAHWLVTPLTKLVTAVRTIGQGDLDQPVQVRHAPEYNHLADEINKMRLGLQDRMRMRKSLSLAMEVQRNLLPSVAPEIAGLDIAGHSTYCDETGGDYYDYLDVSGAEEGMAVIAVGDVMGHGVAAAMLMATARGILRSHASRSGSLSELLDHLNELLVPDTRGQRFMTMLLVTVSSTKDTLRWASAGHGPPIIYNSRSDEFLELDGGGLPLGLTDDESYEEYTQPGIAEGAIILTATDGLWETMGEDGSAFGMDRVRELLRTHAARPAAEIRSAVLDELTRYRGPAAQDDDLTFVITKVE